MSELVHCVDSQELKKMRAACKLGAEVREFAGTLVKVSIATDNTTTSCQKLACWCQMHAAALVSFAAGARQGAGPCKLIAAVFAGNECVICMCNNVTWNFTFNACYA